MVWHARVIHTTHADMNFFLCVYERLFGKLNCQSHHPTIVKVCYKYAYRLNRVPQILQNAFFFHVQTNGPFKSTVEFGHKLMQTAGKHKHPQPFCISMISDNACGVPRLPPSLTSDTNMSLSQKPSLTSPTPVDPVLDSVNLMMPAPRPSLNCGVVSFSCIVVPCCNLSGWALFP